MGRIQCFLLEKTDEKLPLASGEGQRSLYRRVDTGETMFLGDAPAGAIYRASWYEDNNFNLPDGGRHFQPGDDGSIYIVKTPGGDWVIDSRASNCTLPTENTHKCWCRHGVAPEFNVDKVGNTCAAGAGSILIGNYHGFLRNGWLEDC